MVAAVLSAAVSALGAQPAAAQARTGGTVAAWGDNDFGQGGATAISGGDNHSLAIEDVSSPPVAVDDLYDVDGDDTLDVAAPGVLDNDSDADSDADSEALTAGVADDVRHGTLTLDPDGSITYAPDGNFHGTDTPSPTRYATGAIPPCATRRR